MEAIEVAYRFEAGFSWRHEGSGLLECRAHALRDAEGGVWLIDPIDGAGLDDELEALGGDIVGVVVLLDRHLRAAEPLASRYGARLLVPPGRWRRGHPAPEGAELLAERVDGCPFQLIPLVERQGQWLEWALWCSQRRLLVVPEAVGTAAYFQSRSREPLAVHPILRVVAPPRALLDLELEARPDLLLVGHGDPVAGPVTDMIELAVSEARRELPWYALSAPRHLVRWTRAALGVGRASC